MTTTRTLLSGLLLLCAQQLLALPVRADAPCLDGEYAAFSCTMAGGEKQLSICLHDNAVVYRFGKPGHVELEYPGNSEEAKFVREQSKFPEGIANVLRFARGGTVYTVDDEENAFAADASAASIAVTRNQKQVAHLDCAPGFRSNWKLLDNVLPASDPDAAPSKKAAPAAAKLAACKGESRLAPYPKKVAAIFRSYAETTEPLYAFASAQLGPPQSCDLVSTLDPKLPGADSPDATSFSGSVRYAFAGGCVLLFTLAGPLDKSLIAPAGFPDAKAAKAALEAAAGFPLAKAKKVGKDDLAQALSSWADPDGKSPPGALGAGSKTQGFSDPSVDADDQTTFAELTYRGSNLIAIRTHQ